MRSYVDDDGRWRHRFRQSWLKTSTICTERARLQHVDELPEDDTDAASVGSAVHTAIETCLSDPLSIEDTVYVFHEDFSERMAQEHFRWVKYSERTARAFGERCTRQWWQVVLPGLPEPKALEHSFCLPLYEDDWRSIELSGTIDFVGVDGQLIDWKTASRPWVKWEHERWDIQPTIYTWAAVEEGLIPEQDLYVFNFTVLGGRVPEHVAVLRRTHDWDWLLAKCLEMSKLIEQDLDAWPTNDAHALCSPKWCPAWSACKGRYVADTWPR